MVAEQEYDSYVNRLNSATVAVLALLLSGMVFLALPSAAQINGAPSSVTSINFGNHANPTPGIRPSVTSLGPNGFQQPGNQFIPPACCINPLFPVNPNPPIFQKGHHHRQNTFFGSAAIYVPYPVVAEPDAVDSQMEPNPADDDRGGPTIFDRRGSGQPSRAFLDDYPPRARRPEPEEQAVAPAPAPAPEESVADQPQTVLVFKDGHQLEVQNYAVVGDTLYDLTPGRHRRVPIAELDLKATAKQNDDLGINFQLPKAPETDK